MTSPSAAAEVFTFPPAKLQRPQTASAADTQSLAPNTTISTTAAVHGPRRPGLPKRASESSTRTIRRPKHLSSKSQHIIPTISNLSVPNSAQPSYLKSTKMSTSSNGANSSGAADLLRQAMMQR